MDNSERMITWCRMWSEDPSLAHQLMTAECRQWSGQTTGLDDVAGPAEAVEFMTAYRAEHVNIFAPRVLADGGESFGYVWDVAAPDGRLLTGFDANLLRDGAVDLNWTFVGPRIEEADEAGEPGPDEAELARLAADWVRAAGGTVHREPIADAGRGRVAVLWTGADGTGQAALLVARGGQAARAYTFGGTRAFRY